MIRSSLIVCATLCTGLLACGSNATTPGGDTKDPTLLVPASNDVSGWTVDSSASKTSGSQRAAVAHNLDQAVGLIDGGAQPFYKAPYTPTLFMWQNFVNEKLPEAQPKGGVMTLFILQMPTEDQAKGLYQSLVTLTGTDYTRWKDTDQDWQDPASPPLGTDSRIQDSGSSWWINFYKGVYYVELQLTPSSGPPPNYLIHDPELKQEAMRFAQYIVSKM